MSSEELLSQLRQHWQLPATAQFLLSFNDAFGIEKISTDDLEVALIGYSGNAWISDLFSKLLRALTLNRNISFNNWEEYLNKEYNKRQREDNPFTLYSVTSFWELPLETKLLALYHLCEWQLADPERFRQHLNENEKEESDWRVEPIGTDSSGCNYWLFDDNRLYKEWPPTVIPNTARSKGGRRTSRANSQGSRSNDKSESRWGLIARTSKEWTEVTDNFRKPRGPQEKQLASALHQVLPSVLEELKQTEQERKLQEALENRKRSSRILVKELERAEHIRLAEMRRESQTEQAESRRSTIAARKEEEERKMRAEARELRLAERERRIRDRDARNSRSQAPKNVHKQSSKKRGESVSDRSFRGVSTSSTVSRNGVDNNDIEVEEEDDWVFDCVCGVYGNNLDDGQPMIACERCNVWQHIACVKEAPIKDPTQINPKEWEDVDFYCIRCREKQLSHETSRRNAPISGQYASVRSQTVASSAFEADGSDQFSRNGLEGQRSSSYSSSTSSCSAAFAGTSRETSDEPSMRKRDMQDESSGSDAYKKTKLYSSSSVLDGCPSTPTATRQCAPMLNPVQALGVAGTNTVYSMSYPPRPTTQHQQHQLPQQQQQQAQ